MEERDFINKKTSSIKIYRIEMYKLKACYLIVNAMSGLVLWQSVNRQEQILLFFVLFLKQCKYFCQ